MSDAPATLPGRRLHRASGVAALRDRSVVATLGLRARLLGATASEPVWGWLGPLIVAAVGGVLRFVNLDKPHQLVFDETYYVKQGYSYLKVGYELAWTGPGKDVDPKFTRGDLDVVFLRSGASDERYLQPAGGKRVRSVEQLSVGRIGWTVAALPTLIGVE